MEQRIMTKKEIWRALIWAEKNESNDELAHYFFKICTTLGTFIASPEVSVQLIPYEHIVAEDALYELRDCVAKKILLKIKGQRI